MPRTTKSTNPNPTQQIENALDVLPDFQFDQVAQQLGISEPNLRDRLESKLNNPQAQRWELLPREHQAVIDQIAKDLESELSVRVLPQEKDNSPTTELLEDVPKPKRGKGGKLTEKKTEAIDKGREASTQTQKGVADALTILQAQQGIQDAAQAGSTYLHAFTATLGKVKGQGLTTIAAQMLQELNNKSGFTPDEILQDLGIELSADIQNELMEVLNPALGKYQQATEEILETSWGNGFNLQEELENLTGLMNSSN